ncbi:MAG: hypothetical protein QM667_10880 [Asticcacaulis sp.]
MAHPNYRFFDSNTGEEIYASDDFAFAGAPRVDHAIRDPELVARFGGPAVINRIDMQDNEVLIYVDGSEERLNSESSPATD